MDFRDILNMDIKKNEIVLGNEGSDYLTVDIYETPSIIITGETGSGKSILLDQILLQLIKKYTSIELGIIPIDTSGVELQFYTNTQYTLYSAINDEEKAIVGISRVLKEVDRRKALLNSYNVNTVNEYNEVAFSKLPLLVVAIEDNKCFLRNKDMEKMLSGILSELKGLNILFLLATSDVHNKFFELDKNVLASLLITFDYTNKDEARKVNLEGAEALAIGEFKARYKGVEKIYRNFEFGDAIIDEVLSTIA